MNDKQSGPYALCPWCKKYSTICQQDHDLGNKYSTASCSDPFCNGTVLLCDQCPKFYKSCPNSGTPLRRLMEHIHQCHNVQNDDASSENMDDDCPQLSKRVRADSL